MDSKSLLKIFIILIALTLANAEGLRRITSYPCSRTCNTKYGSMSCWDSTLSHFINSMIQTTVDYRNAAVESSSDFNIIKLESIFNKTWDTFKSEGEFKEFEETIDNDNITKLFEELTRQTLTRLIANLNGDRGNYNKCPSDCKAELLVTWKGLFGGLIGVAILTVVFMIVASVFMEIQTGRVESVRSSKYSSSEQASSDKIRSDQDVLDSRF